MVRSDPLLASAMSQLSFFSRAELAAMRDPAKRRNYWPGEKAFRRDHKIRRDHGKAQRHARRIYLDFQQSCPDEPPPIPPRPPTRSVNGMTARRPGKSGPAKCRPEGHIADSWWAVPGVEGGRILGI
ncbi:hypothetical protein AB0J83_23605 [Actinoplanes sp. NPDC049596]|uniref:hypothetical protein n=1 Tax=unclassified Actinoplanes TaxID=2626549 RepID=UPI003420175C